MDPDAVTVIDRVTAVAAAYVASPACVPLILQVPAFLRVTTSPTIVPVASGRAVLSTDVLSVASGPYRSIAVADV